MKNPGGIELVGSVSSCSDTAELQDVDTHLVSHVPWNSQSKTLHSFRSNTGPLNSGSEEPSLKSHFTFTSTLRVRLQNLQSRKLHLHAHLPAVLLHLWCLDRKILDKIKRFLISRDRASPSARARSCSARDPNTATREDQPNCSTYRPATDQDLRGELTVSDQHNQKKTHNDSLSNHTEEHQIPNLKRNTLHCTAEGSLSSSSDGAQVCTSPGHR
ncbi:hypothetical protein AOLI_G00152610 [Acnodon oligacanthus]